jgi:DNA replication ATP-dependent helicase Dna2
MSHGRSIPLLIASRRIFLSSAYDPTYKRNKDEAEKVVQLLHWIKESRGDSFDPAEDVGVITPWRTQIAQIREYLGDDPLWRSVQIDTIERYQGSEKRIILVSMAVSHARQLAMIQSPTAFEYEEAGEKRKADVERKLLVTLSRAKEHIILIGYEPALSQNPFYRHILTKFDRVPNVFSE